VSEREAGRHPETGQPIGAPLPDWEPPPTPKREPLEGRYCRVEPLDPERHTADLFEAYTQDSVGEGWTYLPYGPFEDRAELWSWIEEMTRRDDPLFYAIVGEQGRADGVASYLRINPEMGSVEVGHIHYSPLLQRTRAATEAMYLMARHTFDELGYRRYEWKCDDLNAPSRAAAERLGFTYEGTFLKDRIYKGRNRDTAWYSMVDTEWPGIRVAMESWLSPDNFDEAGRQRSALATPRAAR
jgi:RimJ/RimL family protein N-acetyltransferase